MVGQWIVYKCNPSPNYDKQIRPKVMEKFGHCNYIQPNID